MRELVSIHIPLEPALLKRFDRAIRKQSLMKCEGLEKLNRQAHEITREYAGALIVASMSTVTVQ